MSYYGYHNCPDEIRHQLDSFIYFLRKYFTNDLTGIYLHGSMCLGHFVPGQSDMDLLVIIEKRLSANERMDLAKYFLSTR